MSIKMEKPEEGCRVQTVLVALDAKYIHTNLAVRSISAFMRKAGQEAQLAQHTINLPVAVVLEDLVRRQADVYIFSCYIWNVDMVRRLAADMRMLLPRAFIAAGGPQVSWHSKDFLRANAAFDAVIAGEGEAACSELCRALEAGAALGDVPGLVWRRQDEICQNLSAAPLCMDELPFAYTPEDLSGLEGRILYYESMRGCPYQCSYCLSSLERGVRYKSLPLVYAELDKLLAAKPRQVKFVDRTFNCNAQRALAIWQYLANNDNGKTNFHFELSGELLDDETLSYLGTVRRGLFQFEIGVQSTNRRTLEEIQRTADVGRLFERVQRLRTGGNIHLHLDLIAGLPEEDMASFAVSFNEVYSQKPHQLQLGMLKVLGGSSMEHKALEYGLVYSDAAPFEVMATRWLAYEEVRLLSKTAAMVELYYNSGRFAHILAHIEPLFASAFDMYVQLAKLHEREGHLNAPLSKMGQYDLLAKLVLEKGAPPSERMQWLCRLDIATHEKVKAVPSWVTVGCGYEYSDEILAFYQDEENLRRYLPAYVGLPPKSIRRQAHIEVLPFDPASGQDGECALLFDYTRRGVDGRALVQRIDLHK